METQQQSKRQLRTPMDPLASLAASFFSAFFPSPLAEQDGGSTTVLLLSLPVAAARALAMLRRLMLLAVQAFISLLFVFLSEVSPPPPPPPPAFAPTLPRVDQGSPAGTNCVGHALGHVLWVASRLPVASRKYELVRGLTERLLDDNVRAAGALVGAVNRAALVAAFEHTLWQLEAAAGGEWPGMELATRAVRSGMRWWRSTAAALDKGFSGPMVKKLAAELLWLAQKMASAALPPEATVQFGATARLRNRLSRLRCSS